jgi:hypothetical protein
MMQTSVSITLSSGNVLASINIISSF